jgi:hypothetical protein
LAGWLTVPVLAGRGHDPAGGVCTLYGGSNLRVYYDPELPEDDSYRVASKQEPPYPPPPPPPAPCNSSQFPLRQWPKFSADNDEALRFDVCNITVEPAIEKKTSDSSTFLGCNSS